MILDLEPVFNNEGCVLPFDYELDLSAQSFSGGCPFTSPVSVKGEVHNITGIVELAGEADFVLSLECDRCATGLRYPVSIKVSHTLVTHLNDEDNDELLLINEMRFDLDSLVTEDIFLGLPAKFLCRDDCKGLCPQCGRDLNEGPCGCAKPTDPRLEALKQLLDN